jgi:glycerate 2-kinase
LVRSAQRPLSVSLDTLRSHLYRIASAGIGAASAHDLVGRALHGLGTELDLATARLHVIAAGKAASSMARALLERPGLSVASVLAVGTHRELDLPSDVEWYGASHPFPDERSVRAAQRALAVARAVSPDEHLLLLLSGGASSLLAAPTEGLTLDDKRRVVRALINGGADIHELNAVRKHLSAVKGGRLAGACLGRTTTLAVSDVIGDDTSVIGSGPGVPDPSTWSDALEAYRRWTPQNERLSHVEALLARGVAGELAETPKPGAPALERSAAHVIGGRRDAMRGAREEAERLGYQVVVWDEPIAGEARVTALEWIANARALVADAGRPMCVVSSGETTVRVTGGGKGGRNQEFALATATSLTSWPGLVAVASVGTDGIDGPTDAAGAVADSMTTERAEKLGLMPARYLEANDSYTFFETMGDLILTGRTDTNVGDLQILLFDPTSQRRS